MFLRPPGHVSGSTINCKQRDRGADRSAGGGILCTAALTIDGSRSPNRATAVSTGGSGKVANAIENFSLVPVVTASTVTDDDSVCSVAIVSYFLPLAMTLKIASPSGPQDSLVASASTTTAARRSTTRSR